MLEWIKRKLGVLALEQKNVELEQQIRNYRDFVIKKVAELKEYTRVDADVGIRGNNTIILTGVYRNKAYIRFYDMGDGEFMRLVERLKNMKDHAFIRHVDALPGFRALFEI